jgi:hypothetical protein
LPPTVSGELTAELVCYARSVAGVQWDRMEAGTLGEDLNPWATKLFDGTIGVIPSPLWLVLFFTSGLIFVYMLFFADSGERAQVQALRMGTVVAVIVSYTQPDAGPKTAQWGSGRHTYVVKRVGRADDR